MGVRRFIFRIDDNFLLWPLHAACGILIPQPEIESMPSSVEA